MRFTVRIFRKHDAMAVLTLNGKPSRSTAMALVQVSLLLIAVALCCIPFADLQLYPVDPWQELGLIGHGLLTPHWDDLYTLADAVGLTIAFALLAVAVAVPLGMWMAMYFHWRWLRIVAASVRSVHEIFWGLLFMQLFGLSASTGLLAILIPYCGVFAKVFAEIIEQQPQQPVSTLDPHNPRLLRYAYSLIPQAWPALRHYVRYRFECALRSSAILGFIGIPTLGFHMESAFKQGHYSEAAALLWVFLLLIASVRYWLRPWLIAPLIALSIWLLPENPMPASLQLAWQFVSVDIWPSSLRAGDLAGFASWLGQLFSEQALPGIVQTLLLTQLALALTAILIPLLWPFASHKLVSRPTWLLGRFALLVLRSTPEMVLAFVFLLLFGPSGLPAVLALALHNGGLIAFLIANGNDVDQHQQQRADDPKGLLRFAYLDNPRQYPAMLALLFYRWEVILRESAMMGILGITTLGFYIDSAFAEIRFDRAFFLIMITALMNIAVDSLARRLRLRYLPQTATSSDNKEQVSY
jgi:phosphonate transport system permease protein